VGERWRWRYVEENARAVSGACEMEDQHCLHQFKVEVECRGKATDAIAVEQ
jgi:hypothetical protein